jgi:hypothetical protein
VPDVKNKFTVTEVFKCININIMAEAWAQISQSYIIRIWKALCCHFIQGFRCYEWGEEMKELKEQFPVLAEQGSFDKPEEVDTAQF